MNRRSALFASATADPRCLLYAACSWGESSRPRKLLELLLGHIVRAAEDVRLGHRPVAQLVHGDGRAEGDETHQTLFREERDELAERVLGVLKLLRGGGRVEHEHEARGRGFLFSIWYSTVVYPGKSSAGRLFSLISARGGGGGIGLVRRAGLNSKSRGAREWASSGDCISSRIGPGGRRGGAAQRHDARARNARMSWMSS